MLHVSKGGHNIRTVMYMYNCELTDCLLHLSTGKLFGNLLLSLDRTVIFGFRDINQLVRHFSACGQHLSEGQRSAVDAPCVLSTPQATHLALEVVVTEHGLNLLLQLGLGRDEVGGVDVKLHQGIAPGLLLRSLRYLDLLAALVGEGEAVGVRVDLGVQERLEDGPAREPVVLALGSLGGLKVPLVLLLGSEFLSRLPRAVPVPERFQTGLEVGAAGVGQFAPPLLVLVAVSRPAGTRGGFFQVCRLRFAVSVALVENLAGDRQKTSYTLDLLLFILWRSRESDIGGRIGRYEASLGGGREATGHREWLPCQRPQRRYAERHFW